MLTIGFFSFSLIFVSLLFWWAFQALPREEWQIMATIPHIKTSPQTWFGINLTYYGFFVASAYVAALVLFIIMSHALKIPHYIVLVYALFILGACVPASKQIAYLVEGKESTFTVGGASFLGTLIAPWVVLGVNYITGVSPATGAAVIPVLAALAAAYALGEGLGRLACISFGCCYGKAMEECSPFVQKHFSRYAFRFEGKTRKIAYAHSLDAVPVFPVQAVTALIYTATAFISTAFFIQGYYTMAFLLSLFVTQIWRFFSEFLRADYRGEQKISAYQIMGLLTVPYALMLVLFFQQDTVVLPDFDFGIMQLWSPGIILFLQILWIIIFLYTGRSKVTKAELVFSVAEENI